MEKYKHPLLVFDLDGVLVDSETISERYFLACLQQDGFAVDKPFNHRYFLGRSLPDCLQALQQHFNRQPSAAVLEGYNQKVEKALRTELQPVPLVKEALQQMPYPKCVASGSSLSRIQLSLEATGLTSFFCNITSSFEVSKGKPAPDVFLKAAEKNNFSPAHCIVVEDTIFGVQAGLAAGMYVLCYQPVPSLAYSVPAGVTVFDSMAHLPRLVEALSVTCPQ